MQLEFKAGDNKEYKVNSIWDSAVDTKELTEQLLRLYYLILWEDYPKKKNTWESTLVIQQLQRLVTAYHKHNPKKLIATSTLVDTAPPIARPTTALTKKCGQSAKSTITI